MDVTRSLLLDLHEMGESTYLLVLFNIQRTGSVVINTLFCIIILFVHLTL